MATTKATPVLDIKRELEAIDLRNYDFYKNLTEVEKKAFSPFVLMRYISNAKGDADIQEWFLEMTNELVNKHHWELSKDHKELLWKLCAGVGVGEKMFHQYLPACKKGPTNKVEKLLALQYPSMKMSDVKLLASQYTKQDVRALCDELGFDNKQRKEYE